jgi:membrane-associated phospholipid phosphatase
MLLNKICFRLLSGLVFAWSLTCFAQVQEEAMPISSVFTSFAQTSNISFKSSFGRETLPAWGVMLGSTALLYQYDEQIYAEGQRVGRNLGLGNEDNTRTFVSGFGQELVRLPTDIGSAMYFIGDGWTHGLIAIGMGTYGHVSNNNYTYNTGLMIAHGMIVSTVYNQALKRSFGRESPNVKTSERGAWNLFPPFNEYNSRTGSYDAMPSGHVMTATLTWTILKERYPEYHSTLNPIGIGALTLLSFQMINNGVHWASDYPLGIAMGYVIGKASTKMMSSKDKNTDNQSPLSSWMILPQMNKDMSMITLTKVF